MDEEDQMIIQKVGNGYLLTYQSKYDPNKNTYQRRVFVVRSEAELLTELPGIMAEPMKGFIHPKQEVTLDEELKIPSGITPVPYP